MAGRNNVRQNISMMGTGRAFASSHNTLNWKTFCYKSRKSWMTCGSSDAMSKIISDLQEDLLPVEEI